MHDTWSPARLHGAALQGKRAALRSATIMIRQPLQRMSGMQASDIDIYRKITREKTSNMVRRRISTAQRHPAAAQKLGLIARTPHSSSMAVCTQRHLEFFRDCLAPFRRPPSTSVAHPAMHIMHACMAKRRCLPSLRPYGTIRACARAQAKYLGLHTQKTEEEVIRDFQRPRYFTPYEAVTYGLIDKVSGARRGAARRSVQPQMERKQQPASSA